MHYAAAVRNQRVVGGRGRRDIGGLWREGVGMGCGGGRREEGAGMVLAESGGGGWPSTCYRKKRGAGDARIGSFGFGETVK